MSEHSKTKTSFYRRLFVAHLIECSINTVPAIMKETAMPRRTVQDTILALNELDIECEFVGGNKNGGYCIKNWGAINRVWITENIVLIKRVLGLG